MPKIVPGTFAIGTCRPVLWSLTSLSNAPLKTALKPLHGGATTSGMLRSDIRIWAEILYKRPSNFTDSGTLYQPDKQSLSHPDPHWIGCHDLEERDRTPPPWAIFEEVSGSLTPGMAALTYEEVQRSYSTFSSYSKLSSNWILVSIAGACDSIDPPELVWAQNPLGWSFNSQWSSNERSTVKTGNHWRREAPPVIGLEDPPGFEHIWKSLIMAFTHSCKRTTPISSILPSLSCLVSSSIRTNH